MKLCDRELRNTNLRSIVSGYKFRVNLIRRHDRQPPAGVQLVLCRKDRASDTLRPRLFLAETHRAAPSPERPCAFVR
jgi:hypothetical protein